MNLQERAGTFDRLRPRLRVHAYRMLGSLSEAEDAVQETYIRWHQAAAAEVRSPEAWLITALTRICIDQLRAARARRETYIGSWLPEPLLTEADAGGADLVEFAADLSMALLMVLERLTPVERAAFLLHDVFEHDYAAVAAAIGKSEAACRQILHRARERVQADRPRFAVAPEQRARLLDRFLAATRNGDTAGLKALFADDITLWSDGGGKAKAALNPIHGADKVARFFLGITGKQPPGARPEIRQINGEPGLVGYVDGMPYFSLTIEVAAGVITAIYTISNPDKLRHLRGGRGGPHVSTGPT